MKPALILITGANGYIGWWLRKKIPHAFLTLDSAGPADINTCISRIHEHSYRLRDVTHVVHLADARLEEYSEQSLARLSGLQSDFLRGLAALPRLEKVLFSSSCSVYGCAESEIEESTPPRPNTHYAESKLRTEEALRASGLPGPTILRFGTAFGWSGCMRWDLLPNQLARARIRNEPMRIFDRKSVRPYVHAEDFAAALLHALEFEPDPLTNIVESNWSKEELLTAVPWVEELSLADEPKRDPRNYRVSGRLARDRGFRFGRNMPEGLADLVQRGASPNA